MAEARKKRKTTRKKKKSTPETVAAKAKKEAALRAKARRKATARARKKGKAARAASKETGAPMPKGKPRIRINVPVKFTLEDLFRGRAELRDKKVNPPRPSKVRRMLPIPRNRAIIVQGESYGTKMYQLTLTFYKVDFSLEEDAKHPLSVSLGDGQYVWSEQLLVRKHPVQIRCSCPDFRWTWGHWDHIVSALSGPDWPAYVRKTNRGPRNPLKVPGLCKHVVGLMEVMQKQRILK